MSDNQEKKKSLYEKKQATITFDMFDPKSQEGKKTKRHPLHMDYHMGTFGDQENKENFGGNIQGGLSGIIVNLNNGNSYRITAQQMVDFVAEQEGE